MAAVTSDFMEAPDSVTDSVCGLAGNMMSYAPADVFSGDFKIDELDTQLVQQAFKHLLPTNVNMALATKDFKEKEANKRIQCYSGKNTESPNS